MDSPFPPERHQHDRITRSAEQIADSEGGVGQPYIAEGLLGRLLRRGQIDVAQWYAGEKFRDLFHRAGLHPLRARDTIRHIGASDMPHGAVYARRQIHDAIDALGGIGSPCGCCCWFTLGIDLSLAEWSRREGWGGRPIRHETATLVLCGSLSVLAAHFRLSPRENG